MKELGLASDQRRRPAMEDRAVTGPVVGGFLIGVFDGHGGSAVAGHAARRALVCVEWALARGLQGPALWTQVFQGLDRDETWCGSTATLVLLAGRELSVAWVGDSRAILVTTTAGQVLTPDHRIERADERRRVLAAGACLEPPYVVDPETGRGLMVTRALGDRGLRGVGVVAEPEAMAAVLAPGDVGLVVATDGLWDVVGSDEAAAVCRAHAPEAAAAELVRQVAERGGTDNVTVVVAAF
jgi:serine/threonine protein phosphatase PrpC